MLDSALLRFDPWKKATCLRGHFAHTILRNHLLSENMQCGNYASFNVTLNYLMHEIMKSCMTSSLAFDNWEQKYCQTLGNKPNYSHCAARTIIFHFFLVCFPQCTLFFRKVCFLLPICLQCIICGSHVTKDKCCVVQSARKRFASLGLFTFAGIANLLQLWIKTSELIYSIWATPK